MKKLAIERDRGSPRGSHFELQVGTNPVRIVSFMEFPCIISANYTFEWDTCGYLMHTFPLDLSNQAYYGM